MTTMYLCYQSLLDPLTWSQVVAYLEGLARAGYRPILVTFEPRRLTAAECAHWERRLHDLGIAWRRRGYHKWPTVPATALDIACGVATGLWLIGRYRVRLVHARAHVPAVMAALLRILTGVPFLFDVRGFMAEEYVDSQVWPADGFLFRATKRAERLLVDRAAGIVILTESAAALFRKWYPRELASKPLEVIPCCVDLRTTLSPRATRDSAPVETPRRPILMYVGKLGGRYPTRGLVDLFAAARRIVPDLHLNVLTQADSAELQAYAADLGLEKSITIGRVDRDQLDRELIKASAGLCLNRGDLAAVAISPTKIPEYLAAGLPVVSSRGIGDVDRILANHGGLTSALTENQPVGVLVNELAPQELERAARELVRLMNDPQIRAHCRNVAQTHFDLVTIGWGRYQRLYLSALGQPDLSRGRSNFAFQAHGRSQTVESASAVSTSYTTK